MFVDMKHIIAQLLLCSRLGSICATAQDAPTFFTSYYRQRAYDDLS